MLRVVNISQKSFDELEKIGLNPKPQYIVFSVYEGSNDNAVRFYVLNSVSRKVQSVWTNLIQARQTARLLNQK